MQHGLHLLCIARRLIPLISSLRAIAIESTAMKIFRKTPYILCPALIACLSGALNAQDINDIKQTISLASYYSTGDYGEGADTDILYFPLSYTASRGKWGAQLTVPKLRVDGIGNVLVNIGGVNRAVASDQRERNSGIGDSTLAVTYQMDPISSSSPFIDFRLNIKLPTADREKGLGTGELDYSAQVDISQNYGNSVFFGTIGYTFRGDTDFYAGLQDSTYIQLGVARPLARQWNVGVFYDYREPASSFSPEIHEIVPYFSWQITDSWSFTGLAAFGSTEASAETALLGQISYSW
ncbi:MAG: hypothetical protein WDZ52_02890 [Pseudohongiellaceae bacterium]